MLSKATYRYRGSNHSKIFDSSLLRSVLTLHGTLKNNRWESQGLLKYKSEGKACLCFVIYMLLSNNPSSGDINLLNLSFFLVISVLHIFGMNFKL